MSHMDERTQYQACPEFEAVLEDYVSDELSGAEKDRVAAHLHVCARCAAAVDATLHGRSILRLAGDAVEDPGPFFTRRVMSRIQALDQRSASEKSFWKPLEILGAARRVGLGSRDHLACGLWEPVWSADETTGR